MTEKRVLLMRAIPDRFGECIDREPFEATVKVNNFGKVVNGWWDDGSALTISNLQKAQEFLKCII